MPHYRYQAKSTGGQTTNGVVTADNALMAAQTLRAQGNQVLQLAPMASATQTLTQRLKGLNYTSGPSQRDVLNMTTQLAVMVRAGISLRAALEGIADQTENPRFREILTSIKQDVESGKQLSEALAKHPKLFGALYINMVRASEMSGSFSKMLERIAAYLSQQIETRQMVVGAMIYPGVIASLAVAVTIFLLTFVLPRFAAVFEGKESAMPGPTIFLMNLSEFMVQWWWAVVLGLIIAVIGFVMFVRTEAGGWWFDSAKLKFPIFKRMFRALYISRSLHTMGELVNAGVPMLETLAITAQVSGNACYKGMWERVHAGVKQGDKIAEPLRDERLLPRNVVQMISAGEESGRLGEVMRDIAEFYAKELRGTIKAFTSMIEPVMIIIMGLVVGFIAMSIILPIFKMSSLVR